MPDRETIERARRDRREGKSASAQAGEFVREEMHHIREGKHGARSTKQAIAIGLSKARRQGVKLPPPKNGPARTRKQAARDYRKGRHPAKATAGSRRSRASLKALKKEPHRAASRRSLARQARQAARKRSRRARSSQARRAARTRRSRRA